MPYVAKSLESESDDEGEGLLHLCLDRLCFRVFRRADLISASILSATFLASATAVATTAVAAAGGALAAAFCGGRVGASVASFDRLS